MSQQLRNALARAERTWNRLAAAGGRHGSEQTALVHARRAKERLDAKDYDAALEHARTAAGFDVVWEELANHIHEAQRFAHMQDRGKGSWAPG